MYARFAGDTILVKRGAMDKLAKQLGNPRAMRAVGAANGRTRFPSSWPCHRVIGSSGKLTGFAGGLETKAQLLNLEESGARLFV